MLIAYRGFESLSLRQILLGFHPETVLFRPGGVNLRACLCSVQMYASAQPRFSCQYEKYLVSELETSGVTSGVSGWKLLITAACLQQTIPVRPALQTTPTVPVNTALVADHPLRIELIAGSRATEGYESRQVRKEAAAVTAPVCRGEAQLSVVSANSSRMTPRLCIRILPCLILF